MKAVNQQSVCKFNHKLMLHICYCCLQGQIQDFLKGFSESGVGLEGRS